MFDITHFSFIRSVFLLFVILISFCNKIYSNNIQQGLFDLIPDDKVREAKLAEINRIKQKTNKNLSDIKEYSKFYSKCLHKFYSCSERFCDKNLKGCVSTEIPLKEDKILNLSLECYPEYRNCIISSTSKASNSDNPEIAEVYSQINSDQMIDMAVDSISVTLSDEYVKLMKNSCESAGGFYYQGICGVFVIQSISQNYFRSIPSDQVFESVMSNVEDIALILPGVALSSDSIQVKSSTETVNQTIKSSFFNKVNVNKSIHGVSEQYSFSTNFFKMINSVDSEKIKPIDNFVFVPSGWGNIINNNCFMNRIFIQNSKNSAINRVLTIVKEKNICEPSGFIKDKINSVMKQNWSQLFHK